MDDQVNIYYGQTVKAMGDGRVAGWLCLYSTPDDPDTSGEFFTPDTDFDIEDGAKTAILYHHGLDKTIGNKKIGSGVLSRKELGIWIEGQMNLRDSYEQAIYGMVEAGKLGWSSGTIGQRIERVKGVKSTWLKSWALGLDASLTPIPCEPRTRALPLKSLLEVEPGQTLNSQTETVLEALKAYETRIRDFVGLKQAEDRKVSQARRDQFSEIKSKIEDIINQCEPKPDPELVAMKLRLMKQKLHLVQ